VRGGAESYDRKKASPSIKDSIFSGYSHVSGKPTRQVEQKCNFRPHYCTWFPWDSSAFHPWKQSRQKLKILKKVQRRQRNRKETPRRRITVTSSFNETSTDQQEIVRGEGGKALLCPPPTLSTAGFQGRYLQTT
jgi:hypothetical protein